MTKKEHYASDVPVTEREGDQLKRWSFAERIADTLAVRGDPASLVVGVYGRWGEGKTTVLGFIERRLAEHPNVVVVRFNPWLFTTDGEVFAGFFEQLARAVDKKLDTSGFGDLLREYKDAIVGGATLLGSAAQYLAGVPHARTVAGSVASTLVAVAGKEPPKATPTELRDLLEKQLAEAQKRVVVLVDDIDRLDKNEVQSVFRLLKVAADFRWTSYVVAFDREIVAGALAELFPARPDGGDEFLEKIVQVPLPLPPVPSVVLRRLLLHDVQRVLDESQISLTTQQAHRFTSKFDSGLLALVETPRAAKRYVNALQFVLPLLRGEVEVVDLMLIEAVRIFHPKLYAAITRNRELLVSHVHHHDRDDIEAARKDLGSALTPGRAALVERLLVEDLFPRAKANVGFLDSMYQAWAREKRITSERYFSRYFSSGVPAGDVPDAVATEFVATAATTPEKATDALRTLLRDADADVLVQKLFDVAMDLDEPAASRVARAIVEVGQDVVHDSSALGEFLGPRGRLALLVAMLLTRSRPPRDAAIADVLSYGSLPFAMMVFRRLRPAESEGSDERAATRLTEDEWRALGRQMIGRVKRESEAQWLLDGPEGPFRLAFWREFGERSELRDYMATSLAEEPARALTVIRSHCSTPRNISTGELYTEPLNDDGYRRIGEAFDLATLSTLLDAAYGAPPATGEGSSHYVRNDAELAHSFLRLHAAAVAAASTAAAPPAEVGGP